MISVGRVSRIGRRSDSTLLRLAGRADRRASLMDVVLIDLRGRDAAGTHGPVAAAPPARATDGARSSGVYCG